MRISQRRKGLWALICLVLGGSAAHAQGFTCRIGTSPSCLSYGETICSSRGQCVDQNAICFDQYQCDYEGFTCKSNLTECGRDFDQLVDDHNDLVDDFNSLLADHERALEALDDLGAQVVDLEDEAATLERCLLRASTVSEAQDCMP